MGGNADGNEKEDHHPPLFLPLLYAGHREDHVGDGDVDYDISLQDSHFDHNYHTLWGRLKRAAKALFGKPVLDSDVYLWKESEFR